MEQRPRSFEFGGRARRTENEKCWLLITIGCHGGKRANAISRKLVRAWNVRRWVSVMWWFVVVVHYVCNCVFIVVPWVAVEFFVACTCLHRNFEYGLFKEAGLSLKRFHSSGEALNHTICLHSVWVHTCTFWRRGAGAFSLPTPSHLHHLVLLFVAVC